MIFKKNIKKRAISPLISTILIILVVVVLIGILSTWSKQSTKEKLQKTYENIPSASKFDCINSNLDIKSCYIDPTTNHIKILVNNSSNLDHKGLALTIQAKDNSNKTYKVTGIFDTNLPAGTLRNLNTYKDFYFIKQDRLFSTIDVNKIDLITLNTKTCPSKMLNITDCNQYSTLNEDLILHLDQNNTDSYDLEPTVNLLTNGNFSEGNGIPEEGGSNPLNEIIYFPDNPGTTDYVLRSTAVGGAPTTEYDVRPLGMEANTTYVMSCWYREDENWNGNNTAFHSRAFSASGSHVSTSTDLGNLIRTQDINGKTWEYRYQNITTPSDFTGTFRWYVGYRADNTDGYRFFSNLQVEEKDFPTPFTATSRPYETGWRDLSDQNNHTDLTNMSFNDNGEMVFDGSSYGEIDSEDLMTTKEQTYSIWFNGSGYLFQNNNDWSDSCIKILPDEVFYSIAYSSSGNVDRRISKDLSDGLWHNIILKIDTTKPNGIQFYIDGNLEDSYSIEDENIVYETSSFLIGAGRNGVNQTEDPDSFFNGSLPSIRVYNKALSTQEIEELYYSTKDKYLID